MDELSRADEGVLFATFTTREEIEKLAAEDEDWSTQRLNITRVWRKVAVDGWLLFDGEHITGSCSTSPGNPQSWRATAWEVHPIPAIRVLP